MEASNSLKKTSGWRSGNWFIRTEDPKKKKKIRKKEERMKKEWKGKEGVGGRLERWQERDTERDEFS